MNEYGFDYMNYITNIPNSMTYNQLPQVNTKTKSNFMMNQPDNYSQSMHHQNLTGYQMDMKQKDFMKHHAVMKQQPLEPTKGWLRGNLFANLYEPYKNYKPAELDPKNEQEALLYQLMQYKFALIELNLYLDTHPNDTEMLNLYKQYLEIEKQMRDKYEGMYGPLTVSSNYVGKNNWEWNKNPWPWEGV